MSCIADHKSDGPVLKSEDRYIKTKPGQLKRRQITVGWNFCVKWKDVTVNWLPLSTLKESNHVDICEYAVACGLDNEPAFAWWVPYTL